MNEQNKTSSVKLCAVCEDYDNTCGHDLTYNGFRCNLCLFVHSLNSEAQRCCMDMVSKAVTDASCLAPVKQKRDKGLEYPTEAIARKRGR